VRLWTIATTLAADIAGEARLLEQAGWDGMFVPDTQCVLGDVYVALAVAAGATSAIGLGTGVTNPVTRHAAVTASSIATLQVVSGGRAVLGIGRGDASLAHIGLAPAPVSVLDQYIRRVQRYLRGEGVAFDDSEGSVRRADKLMHDAPEDSRLQWLDPATPKVPVEVVASGPRVIALGAILAERLTLAVGADVGRLRWAVDIAREARGRAGLDPDSLSIGAYVNLVAHPDRAAALRLGAAGIAAAARFAVMHGRVNGPVSVADGRELQKLLQGYDMRQHGSGSASHATSLSADFLAQYGIVGPPGECLDRVRALQSVGLDRLLVLGGLPDGSQRSQAELDESKHAVAEGVVAVMRRQDAIPDLRPVTAQ
jgi:5,10-methylenetetrahydromethanopterin reductase